MAERVRLADIRETAKIAATMPGILPEHIAAVAALEAVLALHKRISYASVETRRVAPWAFEFVCEHCATPDGGAVEYPCPTVRAIESVIDLGGSRE